MESDDSYDGTIYQIQIRYRSRSRSRFQILNSCVQKDNEESETGVVSVSLPVLLDLDLESRSRSIIIIIYYCDTLTSNQAYQLTRDLESRYLDLRSRESTTKFRSRFQIQIQQVLALKIQNAPISLKIGLNDRYWKDKNNGAKIIVVA